MQKVITVRTYISPASGDEFTENEYPELKKYLEEGYKIIDKIVVNANTTSSSSLTFILDNYK